ncbi:hypothetical protein LEP1GSC124_2761 [Leptospira interrogans serovar Pyrogenes str. 200701872]|uniref:Uncharacterized protein n=1 Tax=Leptospira interrogans serovar Pyrogenes str. 200701872 TaxID=1193029 RepID=M6ZL40_LEPIR|nr:hypothetical protein LEP1GSC124_2761 [Leptospira interrogans serovar Pyrogenes str. 200701872]
MSSGGSPFPTTPILDSFSKDSIIFKKRLQMETGQNLL